jgi:hypothetical protein
VIYPSITEMSAINEAEIVVHQLPELPAGVPVRVKITSPIANGGPALKHIVQVFDGGGHELATNWWDDCGKYYGMRDRMRLREQVEKYVAKNAGADRALVPVLQPRPILPEGADFPKAEGTAVLSVDATGLVSHVEVRGIEDKAVRESINNALGGWLFLPQLKAGQPVATKVKIPLQF